MNTSTSLAVALSSTRTTGKFDEATAERRPPAGIRRQSNLMILRLTIRKTFMRIMQQDFLFNSFVFEFLTRRIRVFRIRLEL